MPHPVYIIGAARSIVAPQGGALANCPLHTLGAQVIRGVLAQSNIAAVQVDELICSNALGAGGNPARLIALAAGLPQRVAGLSIDRQCAGGLDAINFAAQMLASGQADIVLAGGVESHSTRPFRAHRGQDGSLTPYDRPTFSPWPEQDPAPHIAAVALAKKYRVSRAEQDAWAIHSHHKALIAPTSNEIVFDPSGKNRDPYPRVITPRLCRRSPRLSEDLNVVHTAVAADAAAFCVLASAGAFAKIHTQGPVLEWLGGMGLGGDPLLPGEAPVAAITALLKQHQLSPVQLARVEIMEAYAAQAIVCVRNAGLNPAQVNQGGGALARGHPIGASGAVLAVRLFHDLIHQPTTTMHTTAGTAHISSATGLAAIAAVAGVGSVMLVQRRP